MVSFLVTVLQKFKKFKNLISQASVVIKIICYCCVGLQCIRFYDKFLNSPPETSVTLSKDISQSELALTVCRIPSQGELFGESDIIVPFNEKGMGLDYLNDEHPDDWRPYFRTNDTKFNHFFFSYQNMIYICKTLNIFQLNPKKVRIRFQYGRLDSIKDDSVGGINGKNLKMFVHMKGLRNSDFIATIPEHYFYTDYPMSVVIALELNRFEAVPSAEMQCKVYVDTDLDDCVEDKIAKKVNETFGCVSERQW